MSWEFTQLGGSWLWLVPDQIGVDAFVNDGCPKMGNGRHEVSLKLCPAGLIRVRQLVNT